MERTFTKDQITKVAKDLGLKVKTSDANTGFLWVYSYSCQYRIILNERLGKYYFEDPELYLSSNSDYYSLTTIIELKTFHDTLMSLPTEKSEDQMFDELVEKVKLSIKQMTDHNGGEFDEKGIYILKNNSIVIWDYLEYFSNDGIDVLIGDYEMLLASFRKLKVPIIPFLCKRAHVEDPMYRIPISVNEYFKENRNA